MSFTLTKRQAELLEFIKQTIDETGTAPNYDEMAAAIGLNSKSGINRLVCGLERRGRIRRIAGIPRAIEVIAVNSFDEREALLREALLVLSGECDMATEATLLARIRAHLEAGK